MKNSLAVLVNCKLNPTGVLVKRTAQGIALPSRSDLNSVIATEAHYFKDLPIDNCLGLHIGEVESFSSEFTIIDLRDLEELVSDHGVYLCQALSLMWEGILGTDTKGFRAPSLIKKNNNFESVTFYGGSFNPWHDGHRVCVDQCNDENIVIVPDYNPWKQKNQSGVADICRWRSFKRIIKSVEDSPYSVFPGFWGINLPNPTSKWINKVSYKRIGLIIGDDSFMNIEKWYEVHKLCDKLERVYVIPRNEDRFSLIAHKFKLEQTFNTTFELMQEHRFQAVSSTLIRQEIRS